MIFSLTPAFVLVVSACLVLSAARRTASLRAVPVKVLGQHRKR